MTGSPRFGVEPAAAGLWRVVDWVDDGRVLLELDHQAAADELARQMNRDAGADRVSVEVPR